MPETPVDVVLSRSPPSGERTEKMMPLGSSPEDVIDELRFAHEMIGAGVVVGSSRVNWIVAKLEAVVADATVN